MATRKLASFVHVYDEHGEPHAFGPNDDVPSWAQTAITNDAVWADPDHVTDASQGSDEQPARSRRGRAARDEQ